RSFKFNSSTLANVRRLSSTIEERPSTANRSADRNGAQPVMIGSLRGIVVHQVGNDSSCVNRKLILDSDLLWSFGGEMVSQKRCRNRSTTRTTCPISNFSSDSTFSFGNFGANSIAPNCPEAAFKSAIGNVTRTSEAVKTM